MLTPDNCVDSPWLSLDSLTSWHEVHPTQVDIWFTQHKLTWGSPNTSWHMVHPTQVDIWFTQHKLTFGSPNTSWHKVHPTQVDIRFTQHKLTYGSPNTSWSQVSCCYVNALTNETLKMYVAFFDFCDLASLFGHPLQALTQILVLQTWVTCVNFCMFVQEWNQTQTTRTYSLE